MLKCQDTFTTGVFTVKLFTTVICLFGLIRFDFQPKTIFTSVTDQSGVNYGIPVFTLSPNITHKYKVRLRT
jgi:hypothetical protein